MKKSTKFNTCQGTKCVSNLNLGLKKGYKLYIFSNPSFCNNLRWKTYLNNKNQTTFKVMINPKASSTS
jgi:hypothetical protein